MFYVVNKKTFLISGIHFTYKFVISDTKTKQNKIFVVFWNFGQCSLDFNKLVIKAKMHAKTLFSVVWKTTIWFFSFETFGRMHEKYFFFFSKFFFVFERKPGILIPDLYLYSIKIQTDIDQNAVTKLRKITDFLKGFFGILKKKNYWTGPDPKGDWAKISPK